MGVMGVWGISLNAISLVNLVISLGIAAEFCAHVARVFMSCGSGLPVDRPAGQKERDQRMVTALVDVQGPSESAHFVYWKIKRVYCVFSCVRCSPELRHVTKLIGMFVLALTCLKSAGAFLPISHSVCWSVWVRLCKKRAREGVTHNNTSGITNASMCSYQRSLQDKTAC